jgi:polyribonucleotide nucleotidyltransferase
LLSQWVLHLKTIKMTQFNTKHMMPVNVTLALDSVRNITIETGKLARQADGSVVVRMGNAMLLATCVSKTEADPSRDFLPLSVDYQERYASNGRIPGGFLKREGRLSDSEILISRLVDRTVRPMFPEGYFCDTQVNIYLISADDQIPPDALACLAASAALTVSDIPLLEPIAEVRVCRVSGRWIINPTFSEILSSDIDLLVGGTSSNILMVEGECKEVAEEDLIEAIKLAHMAITRLCQVQVELAEKAGATSVRQSSPAEVDHEIQEEVLSHRELVENVLETVEDQGSRSEVFNNIVKDFSERTPEEERKSKTLLFKKYFDSLTTAIMRERVLGKGIRLDGRNLHEVRPIWCEIDYLPAVHGSAIFTRGETQSLTSATIGSSRDSQLIDTTMVQGKQNFLLHYNFPGFSTGEVKINRGPGRREIGHGNLAMRSLKQVMPEEFPYTVRIVSDILESNGSSSMATVCAGSLALMDAGVAIKSAVSGIAMGLVMDGKRYAVLSDISADEDHLGDMDFKVTGTAKGICACQMDLKTTGIPFPVMLEALIQARDGRLHILEKMNAVIEAPRKEFKPIVPRIEYLFIPKDMIGSVIGPGGKIIQEIQKQSGATISLVEEGNQGRIEIFAPDSQSLKIARDYIKKITVQPTVGEVYQGTVTSIMAFGAFVQILPGKDGLLHVSELAWERVAKTEDVLQVGDSIEVMLKSIDEKTGKISLSRKALIPKRSKVVVE